MDCAKLIANSGLARLVMRISDNDEHRHPEKVTIFLRQYMYVEVVAYDLWRL